MAKKIMIAGEKYTDAQGAEKVKWIEAGVILEKNGKEFVLLHKHVNLAAFESQPGKTSVICSVFADEPRQQGGGYSAQQQQQAPQQPQQQNYSQNMNNPTGGYGQERQAPQLDQNGQEIPF